MISSQRVAREFKMQTGCETAIGVELESSGVQDLTAGSHWEDRSVISDAFIVKSTFFGYFDPTILFF